MWRCKDCLGQPLYCRAHCREFHRAHIFHRIQQWTGKFYAERHLWQVGVRIFLGHGGEPCPKTDLHTLEEEERKLDEPVFSAGHFGEDRNQPLSDSRGTNQFADPQGTAAHCHLADPRSVADPNDAADPQKMVDDEEECWEDEPVDGYNPYGHTPPAKDVFENPFVLFVDCNQLFSLPAVHCGCGDTAADDLMFFDLGFFPASFTNIKTVFTFRCLDDFRLSNLECKTSAYQYFQKLKRLTNPAFPNAVPNRYAELRRLSRQWRNLKLRKWFGFGLRPEEPGRGEMALFCAACPQPGVNLSQNWQTKYTECGVFFSTVYTY